MSTGAQQGGRLTLLLCPEASWQSRWGILDRLLAHPSRPLSFRNGPAPKRVSDRKRRAPTREEFYEWPEGRGASADLPSTSDHSDMWGDNDARGYEEGEEEALGGHAPWLHFIKAATGGEGPGSSSGDEGAEEPPPANTVGGVLQLHRSEQLSEKAWDSLRVLLESKGVHVDCF